MLPWHGCASFPMPKPQSTTHCCHLHLALLYSDQPARVTESCQVPLRSLFYAPFQHVFKGLSLSCVIGRVLGLTLSDPGSLILLSQGREMIISSQSTSRGSCDGQTQKYIFTYLKNPKPENKCEVLLMFFFFRREQKIPPQNVPLGHKDYFELQTLKNQVPGGCPHPSFFSLRAGNKTHPGKMSSLCPQGWGVQV